MYGRTHSTQVMQEVGVAFEILGSKPKALTKLLTALKT